MENFKESEANTYQVKKASDNCVPTHGNGKVKNRKKESFQSEKYEVNDLEKMVKLQKGKAAPKADFMSQKYDPTLLKEMMEMSVIKKDELLQLFSPPPNMCSPNLRSPNMWNMRGMADEVEAADVHAAFDSPVAKESHNERNLLQSPNMWNMAKLEDEVNADEVANMFGSPKMMTDVAEIGVGFSSPGMNCMRNLMAMRTPGNASLLSPPCAAQQVVKKRTPEREASMAGMAKRDNYHHNIEAVTPIKELDEDTLKQETFFFKRQNSQEKLAE